MTSLTPSPVKQFPENSNEKKVYNFVDTLAEYLPIVNDRNRLSYCLLKYINGEGDKPEILVKTQKMKIEGISQADLAKKLNAGLNEIKK
jgi:hypothetical protein